MVKLLIKSLVLAVLILILIFSFDQKFKNQNKTSFTMEQYHGKVDAIDIAIFGSSHAYCSYDPRIFETDLNLSTFTFGARAQRLISGIPLMEKVVKENNLKLAVVDIFKSTIETEIENDNLRGLQFETFDNTPLTIEKLKSFKKVFPEKKLTNVSPTLRNHSDWFNIFRDSEYIPEPKYDYYNGYWTKMFSFNDRVWKRFLRVLEKKRKTPPKKLERAQKAVIDQVINVFQSKNIPLVFVSAPSYTYKHDEEYRAFQHLIAEYIKSKGYKFIDYNLLWNKIDLRKRDFKDPNHLNPKGGLKVSNHLSKQIKNDLGIKANANIQYPQNRYDLINEGFEGVLLKAENLNKRISRKTNIESIYIYGTGDYGYEILLKQAKSPIKNVKVRIKYELSELDKRKHINLFGDKRIRENTVTQQELLAKASRFAYKGSVYSICQIRAPYDLNNLTLYLGKGKGVKVLDSINLKINSNDR